MDKSKHTVLVVEDSKISQKLAELQLTDLGCNVKMAETGKQALELTNSEQYDLILVDLGLPDMDGLTVIETLRKRGKPSNIPIVVLTAHNAEDIRESCKRAGILDFLVKPLTLEKSQLILEKYLQR